MLHFVHMAHGYHAHYMLFQFHAEDLALLAFVLSLTIDISFSIQYVYLYRVCCLTVIVLCSGRAFLSHCMYYCVPTLVSFIE